MNKQIGLVTKTVIDLLNLNYERVLAIVLSYYKK